MSPPAGDGVGEAPPPAGDGVGEAPPPDLAGEAPPPIHEHVNPCSAVALNGMEQLMTSPILQVQVFVVPL